MQLKNDRDSLLYLTNLIEDYYPTSRSAIIFEYRFTQDEIDGYSGYFVRWLLDRKNVFEYRITEDRGMLLSVVSMGIGPAYFTAHDFWNYENAERFSLEVTEIAIIHNLRLLDEFISCSLNPI